MRKMSETQRTAILLAFENRSDDKASIWTYARWTTVEVLRRNDWIALDGMPTMAGLIAAGVDMDAIHAEALAMDLAAAQAESDAIDAIDGDDPPMHFRADGSLYAGLTDSVPARCTYGGDCAVHPDARGLHDFDNAPAPTLADDVATLRDALKPLEEIAPGYHYALIPMVDRIAGAVPVPTRVWMHRCGVVLINDTEPPPCHVCVSTPQIPFVRLYSLGEVA